jgi:hypothetical protein
MTEVEILRQVYQSVVMLAGVVALWAVLTVVLHFRVRSLQRTVRALAAVRATEPQHQCGDELQALIPTTGPPVTCILPAGHNGLWHKGNNGTSFVPPVWWTHRVKRGEAR